VKGWGQREGWVTSSIFIGGDGHSYVREEWIQYFTGEERGHEGRRNRHFLFRSGEEGRTLSGGGRELWPHVNGEVGGKIRVQGDPSMSCGGRCRLCDICRVGKERDITRTAVAAGTRNRRREKETHIVDSSKGKKGLLGGLRMP